MRARGGNGKFTSSLETAALDAEAARMRAQGKSLRAIADHQGASVSTVHGRVQRALEAVRVEGAADLMAVELERLDGVIAHLSAVMEREHVAVSAGEVVMLDGRPVMDDDPGVKAAVALIRASESRRKLLGLDAPVAMQVAMERRAEVESDAIVDALLAAVDALQLPPELRQFALDTSAWVLNGRQGPAPERPAARPALPVGTGSPVYVAPPPQPPRPVEEQLPGRAEDWDDLPREQRAAGGLSLRQLTQLDQILAEAGRDA